MRRALLRLVVTMAFVAAVVLLGDARPAAADCAGPTVEHDVGPVAPGETLRVTGIAFGDNCYDTGPPPEGEGTLGKPLGDITISFVQGSERWLVATGAADDNYEFDVEVPVPLAATTGSARLIVRTTFGEAYTNMADPTVEIDATGVEQDDDALEPVEFGPSQAGGQEVDGTEPDGTEQEPAASNADEQAAPIETDNGDGLDWWPAIMVFVVPVIAGAGYLLTRQRA